MRTLPDHVLSPRCAGMFGVGHCDTPATFVIALDGSTAVDAAVAQVRAYACAHHADERKARQPVPMYAETLARLAEWIP